jgi:hypothetical protein
MWALIIDNLVYELTDTDPAGRFAPSLHWVACADTVRQGWAFDGAVFAPPPAPPAPTLAQQAALALSVGLTISLSGTMTLAATLFPTDPIATGKIADVITIVTATEAFPGGATSYPMKDAAGAWHTFTISQYKAVAGALSGYVAPLYLIIDGNPLGATTLPANSVALTV